MTRREEALPAPVLCTIGYEGASLEGLIGALQQAGVGMLVDTRERAQSRRPGFSKTALGKALEAGGVKYRHLRALGTPPAVRKDYKLTHDFVSMRRGYLAHLAAQGDALDELAAHGAAVLRGRPGCLPPLPDCQAIEGTGAGVERAEPVPTVN
ncbi:DUF488 family protein [Deinococcus altitudinis]|uniref:DUF488 domain-containing protein n=1 Tax=Deinococcus altitudinis TaxID=468914 RepID=UPI0038911B52